MSSESREERIESATATKRRVAPLFAKRRKSVNDGHIEDYDKIDDGRKIKKVVVDGPDGTTKTREIDLTSIHTSGISTTSNLDLLVMEAEMVADGRGLKNYHIPANDGVLDRILEKLDEMGLNPPWEVCE